MRGALSLMIWSSIDISISISIAQVNKWCSWVELANRGRHRVILSVLKYLFNCSNESQWNLCLDRLRLRSTLNSQGEEVWVCVSACECCEYWYSMSMQLFGLTKQAINNNNNDNCCYKNSCKCCHTSLHTQTHTETTQHNILVTHARVKIGCCTRLFTPRATSARNLSAHFDK